MRSVAFATGVLAVLTLIVSCGDGDAADDPVDSTDAAAVNERLAEVRSAVETWQSAESLDDAQRAAEEARNLITGPDTFGSGDLDGDGAATGAADVGLLPAEDGRPGLASAVADCRAITADVLGGDWTDAAARWTLLGETIDAWSPRDNTYPDLPSHPQRVVGWADNTLDLEDGERSLERAIDFAGHAMLHVAVSERALEDCTIAES